MKEKKILFTTEGNIKPKDKEKLCKIGILVIEVKALSEMKFDADIDNGLMLESAMNALDDAFDSTKAKFFSFIHKRKFPKPQKIA